MKVPERFPVHAPLHGFTPQVQEKNGHLYPLYLIQFCQCCQSVVERGHSVCPVCRKQSPACMGRLVPEFATISDLARAFAQLN